MATAVESPSIASAKERAASILYGNEKPITPVIAEYSMPVKEEAKSKPTFSSYYAFEPIRAERPTQYRSYETVSEPVMTQEPRVIRPFVDAREMIETQVPVVEEVAPVAVTTKTVQNTIETELDADTQYVVKFKKSTIVAGVAVATVFLLMTILFIVNIISLSTTMAEVNALMQEEQILNQEITSAMREAEIAKQSAQGVVNNSSGNGSYTQISQQVITPSANTASVTVNENGGFFDWLCKSLSNLFS